MNGTIYRIENSQGEGVYRGGGYCSIIAFSPARNNDEHPEPTEDSRLVKNAQHLFYKDNWNFRFQAIDFIFGFQNIQVLKSWFYTNKVLEALHNDGFVVNQYEGEVYHGNTQSVINRDTYKKINSQSLLELMD